MKKQRERLIHTRARLINPKLLRRSTASVQVDGPVLEVKSRNFGARRVATSTLLFASEEKETVGGCDDLRVVSFVVVDKTELAV